MTRAERVAAIAWTVLGVAVAAYAALRIPLGAPGNPGPGFLPLLGGVTLALLGGALAVRLRRGPDDASPVPAARDRRRVALAVAAMAAAAAALETLGFVATMFLLALVLLRTVGRRSTAAALFYATAIAGAVFVVFKLALGLPLTRGALGLV